MRLLIPEIELPFESTHYLPEMKVLETLRPIK
jgi:hypothetical protein